MGERDVPSLCGSLAVALGIAWLLAGERQRARNGAAWAGELGLTRLIPASALAAGVTGGLSLLYLVTGPAHPGLGGGPNTFAIALLTSVLTLPVLAVRARGASRRGPSMRRKSAF